MLFNSIEYLLFLPTVGVAAYLLPHRFRWVLLLAASYAFYMSWNASYALLILFSTVVDYTVGRLLATRRQSRSGRWLLVASLVTNLGLLTAFKYWGFLTTNIRAITVALGLPWSPPELDVLLPVGISFYTFQTLSYTIDVYRGDCEPEPHFGRFALFVAFFPQLVAGPIERARNLLPQLRTRVVLDWHRITGGLELIGWGLFKKVVIADRLALYVDAVYNNADNHGAGSFLLATYGFAFQIFCDFSGYSDIAIGSAAILGIGLMENFRQPYFATNIRDFWRRWHISLSTWLRDYLYIPLGGGRGTAARVYINLMITMLLGGLWHGASWTFVVWGGLQGAMLAWSRATLRHRDELWRRARVPDWLRDCVRVVITFHLVCLSWVFFRANTLDDALHILASFAHFPGRLFIDVPVLAHGVVGVLILLTGQLVQMHWSRTGRSFENWPLAVRWAVLYCVIFGIATLGVEHGSQFIYFQF